MYCVRSCLIGLLAAGSIPAVAAAQGPRGPTPNAQLIPSLNAGGLWWTSHYVGTLGATVQVEIGKGAVAGAFGLEGWVPLTTDCTMRPPSVCESPDHGAGLIGGARWRHPLGGRGRNTLVVSAFLGAYYWEGAALTLDPDPGFTAGAGLAVGTDLRRSRRRPAMRLSTGIRVMATGATLLTASIGPRIPL